MGNDEETGVAYGTLHDGSGVKMVGWVGPWATPTPVVLVR